MDPSTNKFPHWKRINMNQGLRRIKLTTIFNNYQYRKKVSNYLQGWSLNIPETTDDLLKCPGEHFVSRLDNFYLEEDILLKIFEDCEIYEALELYFQEPIKVIEQPKSIRQVKLGSRFQLDFKVFGLPMPRCYKWFRETPGSKTELSCNNSTLIIEKVCPEDQGLYYCETTQIIDDNEDSDDSNDDNNSVNENIILQSDTVNLEISPELKIIYKPLINMCKYKGESVLLEVKAEGYPEPQYKWTFGDQVVSKNKIEINEFTREDSGKYIYEIWNSKENYYRNEVNLKIMDSLYPIRKETVAEKLALLIGNKNYENYNELDTPLKEINDLEIELKKLDFLVIKRCDLNLSEMNQIIDDFCELLKEENVYVFIYFAGHGFENSDKCLLPIDAPDYKLLYTKHCITEPQILQKISPKNPKLVVLILDMCLSLPKKSAGIYKKKPELCDYVPSKNIIQAYSTSTRLKAYELNKGYCSALVKCIGQDLSILQIIASTELDFVNTIDEMNKPYVKQEPSHLQKVVFDFYLNVQKTGNPSIQEKYNELCDEYKKYIPEQ